ncbi:hypothetical protein YDYSG_56940 [Paenibacillus tyrfis]|uniref:hypothetical protein n=1 Tax=Paenibacillus tyrfis TaxID=1501230 RepID=UPI00249326CB|nr:hypothetical protein [Paenibacillus tyrfis]GLI09662.1 hypothetical protein YDYSG_56940 [Paenibacillus tyrfis]
MKRYNVYFNIDSEIEIGVIVTTDKDCETEREKIVYEARKKLEDRGYNEFTNLECSKVSFLEEVQS